MPVIVYQVKSNRIHDIELKEGTTVGELTETLQSGGYDVCGAAVRVHRASRGDTLVGKVGSYVLQAGDTVDFNTQEIDLPALRREVEESLGEAESHLREAAECCAGCGTRQKQGDPECAECAECCQAAADSCADGAGKTVELDGVVVRVSADSVTVKVKR